MTETTIGKIRWLYNLQLEAATNMAASVKARLNVPFLQQYDDEPFSIKRMEKILKVINEEGSNKVFREPHTIPPLCDGNERKFHGVWNWIHSTEADALFKRARSESWDQYYPVYPSLRPLSPIGTANRDYNMVEYFRTNHPCDVICRAMLDTAVISLHSAVGYLKKEGFDFPARQKISQRNDLGFDWGSLQLARRSLSDILKKCVLPEVSKNDAKAQEYIKMAIAKAKGLSHEKAFDEAYPAKAKSTDAETKRKTINKKKPDVKKLLEPYSRKFGFDLMPNWDTRKK
ncbi:hypothetical protein LJC71_09085 [Desulfosarcina sp. OttesenSCG-928-A07]|nr:hypothetical protein [Desulfosarcina sp. OttesenSCG-928-G17]MDL2329878.1 hypothetical protein [Desulfosarcina sp. OttesenSCG-928-A07]